MHKLSRSWPERLSDGSAEQDAALRELRACLIRGVTSGLSGRAGADGAFVEDVVQTAMVRILQHLDTFRGRSAFTTWALAIALRVAFVELRRRHWNDVSLETLVGQWDVSDSVEDGPREAAGRASVVELVHRLIRTSLTPRQRDVLLADLNSMPQDEIAAQLGVTRNAVYKLGHDARRALKRELERAGCGVEQVRDLLQSSNGGSSWH